MPVLEDALYVQVDAFGPAPKLSGDCREYYVVTADHFLTHNGLDFDSVKYFDEEAGHEKYRLVAADRGKHLDLLMLDSCMESFYKRPIPVSFDRELPIGTVQDRVRAITKLRKSVSDIFPKKRIPIGDYIHFNHEGIPRAEYWRAIYANVPVDFIELHFTGPQHSDEIDRCCNFVQGVRGKRDVLVSFEWGDESEIEAILKNVEQVKRDRPWARFGVFTKVAWSPAVETSVQRFVEVVKG